MASKHTIGFVADLPDRPGGHTVRVSACIGLASGWEDQTSTPTGRVMIFTRTLILTTSRRGRRLTLKVVYQKTFRTRARQPKSKVSESLQEHEYESSFGMRKHGPWTIHNSKTMYADPWLEVVRDEVTRPDGAPGSYATVQLKSGVCVIALDANGQVHLTSEFHYAVGRHTIEGVSGGIEPGESPELTAQRELAEEMGFAASKWSYLGRIDPFTAAICSTVDLFVAEDLTPCSAQPEGTELIESVTLTFREAIEMVLSGEITHAPTCVALLRLALEQQTP